MDNTVGSPITKVMDSKLAAFAFQHYIKTLTPPCKNFNSSRYKTEMHQLQIMEWQF